MKNADHFFYRSLKLLLPVFCLCGLFLLLPSLGAKEFALPKDPTQVIAIQISEKADAKTKEAAQDLSTYLTKIFQKPFPVQSAENDRGIIMGTVEEFPQYADALKKEGLDPRETYLIRTNENGIALIGISPLAVQDAVWDLLHRLGYRHYFPPEKWEIIPKIQEMKVDIDEVSSPSYRSRIIFIGYGMWRDLAPKYLAWQRHNRLESGFALNSHHSYSGIYKRNEEEFRKHPEYLAEGGKFVIANEGLRKLVVEDCLREIEKNPDVDTISVDPSDGGGWPATSPLGSVSDQVVTLANEVARAVREKWPGKKVAIYAYNEHSPAPTIQVDKDVIVSVATAFLRGGNTFATLVKPWHERGATIGVRGYLDVFVWSKNLPGKSLASAPRRVAESIMDYYRLGARYFIAETSDSWGPDGLGLYVASRCLWNVEEVKNVDAMRNDFLEKAFGSAKPAMQQFYDLIDGGNAPLLSDNLLGGMYRTLAAAYSQTTDPAVLERIDDLAAYTHYIEFARDFMNADSSNRQSTFDALVKYSESIRQLQMMHTRGQLKDQLKRDKSIKFSIEATDLSATPPTRAELQRFVKDGVIKYKLLAFKPKAFSQDLVPLSEGGGNNSEDATFSIRQNSNTFFTYCKEAGEEITFQVSGGQLRKGSCGHVKIELFPLNHPLVGTSVAYIEVPPDKVERTIKMKTEYAGLQRIEIKDGGDMTNIRWPSKSPLAISSGQENHSFLYGKYSMYFYVPKGTTRVGGYATNPSGLMMDGSGNEAFSFSEMKGAGFFEVPVPKGEDGGVWKLERCNGYIYFMTVPPYLFPERGALLVPKEVLGK